MLKINIIAIGKNKDIWVAESVIHFKKLLRKHASITINYLPDKSRRKNLSEPEIKKVEADLIRTNITSRYIIALSDKGKKMDSIAFSKWLEKLHQKSGGSVDFIIGGIYGLDETLINECTETISLSPLTMSHQLVRPVLLEQLYRGFSILTGGKYHK